MSDDLSNWPALLLTDEDQRAVVAGHNAMREHVMWTETSRPRDDAEDRGEIGPYADQVSEIVHVCTVPWRTALGDGVLWSIWRNLHGVFAENCVTGEHHRHDTMAEVFGMIRETAVAETAALIAAIPVLTLPTLGAV